MKRVSRSPKAHKRCSYIKKEPTRLRNMLKSYKVGQRIQIKIDPSIHKAMPSPRILNEKGKIISILSERNKIYFVKIAKKQYIINSVHLRPL
jgi:ribosomal protein L21E